MNEHHDTKNLYRIAGYAKKYWKQLALSTLCACVFGFFSAAPSYLIRHAVDMVFVEHMSHLLFPFILGFLSLFMLKGVFMYLSAYYMNWVGFRIVNDIRHDLFNTIIHFPLSFFKDRTRGQIMAHFLNDANLIQEASSSAIRHGMRSLCEATFLIAVAFLQNWKLSLIMFLIGPAVAYAIKKMASSVRSASRVAQKEMGSLSSHLQEVVHGVREIKSYNTQKIEVKRFSWYLKTYFSTLMRSIHSQALGSATIEVVAMSGIGAMLYIGGQQVLSGAMTPGQLSSFFAAILLAYQPIKRLVNSYGNINYALGAADRLFEVMDLQFDEPTDRTQQLPSFSKDIHFKNVSFAYKKETPVLNSIELRIKKGEHIGIFGPSGSGKSTLCDLLIGFVQPTQGCIEIDGIPLDTVTLESLLSQVAYVGQQTFLFNDTVQANITYGSSGAPQSDIVEASKAAHAHTFIEELEKGYHATVGENGMLLSGGQKQRLTIARALVKKAPILIFDEATSALDHTSEESIRRAIQGIDSDTTLIVISHRLTFLQNMDRIFKIERGKLVHVKPSTTSQSSVRANV